MIGIFSTQLEGSSSRTSDGLGRLRGLVGWVWRDVCDVICMNVCHVGIFVPGIEQLAALCVSNLAAAHTIHGFPESRCACLLIAVFVVPYRIVPMPSKSQNMCGGGVAPPPHPITGRWAKTTVYIALYSVYSLAGSLVV